MTAAATLSITLRRSLPRTDASRRARSAVTVVSRSSWVITGTPTTLLSCFASVAAPCAAGPAAPDRCSGMPTTTSSASSSATSVGDAPVVVGSPLRPLDDDERRRDRAAPIGDGDADPLRAEIEAERARLTPMPAAARAMSSAASSPSGFLPPAVATSPLPPPPPPTALAASLIRSLACSPASMCTAATSDTPPVLVTPPSTRRGRRAGCGRRSPGRAGRQGWCRRRGPRRRRRRGGGQLGGSPDGQLADRSALISSLARLDLVELALHAADEVVGRSNRRGATPRPARARRAAAGATEFAPVIASMRRRFEPIELSRRS